MSVMMGCGHRAQGQSAAGVPVCVSCVGLHPGATVPVAAPDLTGRSAGCIYRCGAVRASSIDLPFFEFRGEGSREATERCFTCGMFAVAHGEVNAATGRAGITSHPFIAAGPDDFDKFYDGCLGWD